MRYVTARINQNTRDETYRVYVTDILAASNHAEVRYYDLANLGADRPQKEVSGEEIISRIKTALKNTGGGEE